MLLINLGGSVIGGEIAEHFGFIKSMECICLTWIVGIICTFVSDNISMLILGKIINGIAVGITFICIPVYQYEIISINRRGRVLSLFLFMNNLGNLTTLVITNLIIEKSDRPYAQKYVRLYWLIELIPLIFAVVLLPFLPESPRWLATNKEWCSAADVLERIEVKNSFAKTPKLQKKIKVDRIKLGDKHFVIKNYSSGAELKSCSINGLFGKKYIKETSVAIIMKFFIDFVAISNLTESIDYISEACQIISRDEVKIVQVAILMARVLFSTIPILISDVMRRKDILVYGMFLINCFMFAYMILFLGFSKSRIVSNKNDWHLGIEFYGNSASTVLALTGLLDVVYNTMIIPISWLYTLESFTLSTRIRGWIVVSSLHWLFQTSITLTFSFLFQHLKGWLFLIISFICIMTLAFTIKLQETKGKIRLDEKFISSSDNSLGESEDTRTGGSQVFKSALYEENLVKIDVTSSTVSSFSKKWEPITKNNNENEYSE